MSPHLPLLGPASVVQLLFLILDMVRCRCRRCFFFKSSVCFSNAPVTPATALEASRLGFRFETVSMCRVCVIPFFGRPRHFDLLPVLSRPSFDVLFEPSSQI